MAAAKLEWSVKKTINDEYVAYEQLNAKRHVIICTMVVRKG